MTSQLEDGLAGKKKLLGGWGGGGGGREGGRGGEGLGRKEGTPTEHTVTK